MKKNNYQIVILAGGKGSRLSNLTRSIPKPMVKANNLPIIVHIMKHYYNYGFKNFIVATGYKSKIIKSFFKTNKFPWKTQVCFTGLNTMTGGRIRRLRNILKNKSFFLTYGDGLSNINLDKLLKFHKKKKGVITLTAVRPPARFGAIEIKNHKVVMFREKSRLDTGWINGGFFIMEPEIFKYLKNDRTYLEREPLEKLGKKKKLFAYQHNGFWQCVDTPRDLEILEKILKKKNRAI